VQNSKTMNNKLFVGGLSYDTTEATLQQTFGQAGSVTSAKIMMDKMTGRPRGFGFVEMSSDEEAQKAISMFDQQMVDGRKISVSVARPLTERPPQRNF
jgi:RNA recognition motif-containing protein